jgi:hypothetical protein
MPLRKHFILRDGNRHYVNDLAWLKLRTRLVQRGLTVTPVGPDVVTYLNTRQLYADARQEITPGVAFRPAGMPSWRREIPLMASALHDAGHSVDMRVFHSRKHARRSRSKLHAVRASA